MNRPSLVITLLAALLAPAFAHAAPGSTAQVKSAPATKSAASKSAKPTTASKPTADTPAKSTASNKASSKTKGPCYAKPVQLMRVRGTVLEPREISLTFCSGKPNPAAIDTISVLARPRDVERPLLPEIKAYRARPAMPKKLLNAKVTAKNAAVIARAKSKYRDPQFVTERVLRVDPGLLERLQKVANHFPGKVIEIISGYRPDSRETSRHHHGLALDMRVSGITRERLRDYVRTFEKTGVGYYPNSFFVHMDVRDVKGFWIDRAGPGEPADYGPWPPTKQEVDKQREAVLRGALAAVSKLGSANTPQPLAHAAATRVVEPEQEPDDMRQDEIARVRDEARRALQEL